LKSQDKIVYFTGEGSWLSYLNLDGKTWWTVDEPLNHWIFNDGSQPCGGYKLLPSDMMHRPDVHFMLNEEWEKAENAKVELEER
jgi:hypothetical protein